MVDTAKYGLTTIVLRITEAEREHRLIDEGFIDHVVDGRHYTVDRDGIVGKAKNAVEPGLHH